MFEKLNAELTSERQRAAYLEHVQVIERKELLESPDRAGKLSGVSVLKLSINCGRALFLERMKAAGIYPKSVKSCSCFDGDCWHEFTVANRFEKARQQVESIAEYRPLIIDAASVAALVKPGRKSFRETFIYREGQAGCSSHAFIRQACGFSPAVAWLQAIQAAGLKTKTIFISAGYAPVTLEEYRDLLPYRNLFKLHFSLSGWFSKEEINTRLAAFELARAAGLDPVIRLVTNQDHISGVAMENEKHLLDLLQALQVDRAHILETPFHDDSIQKKNQQKRSAPALDRGPVCCETGHCNTCHFRCMTAENQD